MWEIDVPKILHVYWGGERLPYIRLLTFKSFMRYNPGWEIWLWMPKRVTEKVTWQSKENDYSLRCNNFLPSLLSMPIKKIYVDFEGYGQWANAAEVHRADYIRILSMQRHGGVWSDTDIIYFKPMTDLMVNTNGNKSKEVFVTICDYGHSTGFLMARKNSFFFKRLMDNITGEFNPTHYQCIGPIMFNKYFPHINSIPHGVNIHMDAVYRYTFKRVPLLISGRNGDFNNESIGCHWYGGHGMWEDFIRKTNGGLINIPDNIIGKLLKAQGDYTI